MRYRIFVILFISINIFFLTNCNDKSNMNDIESILNNIKNEFVPDKRVGILNIEFELSGRKIVLNGESDNKIAVNNLMRNISEKGYTVVNNISILPDKKLGDKHFGIINLSVANIRSKPAHSAELATQSLLGTVVNVLKEKNDWYLIQTPDKYISWVDEDGIYQTDLAEINYWKKNNKIIITEPYCFVYIAPSENSEKVSDLVLGDLAKYIGEDKGFIKIEFPDKRTGFVKTKNVKMYNEWIKDSVSTGETIIKIAKQFIGLPYLWGGTSAKAFDCSGFTKTVYFINGVILPRDASQQVNIGKLIDTDENFDNLQAGDLLFFGRKKSKNKNEKITHVAIYIGKGKFIHAAGRVRINSLFKNDKDFSEYRFNTFIRAKRIIGSYDNGENLVKNNPYYKNIEHR